MTEADFYLVVAPVILTALAWGVAWWVRHH